MRERARTSFRSAAAMKLPFAFRARVRDPCGVGEETIGGNRNYEVEIRLVRGDHFPTQALARSLIVHNACASRRGSFQVLRGRAPDSRGDRIGKLRRTPANRGKRRESLSERLCAVDKFAFYSRNFREFDR